MTITVNQIDRLIDMMNNLNDVFGNNSRGNTDKPALKPTRTITARLIKTWDSYALNHTKDNS